MNAFDRLLASGLDVFADTLRERGMPQDAVDERLDRLRALGLPGLLGFLGTSETGGEPFGRTLLAEASGAIAGGDEATAAGLSRDDVERVLRRLLVERAAPAAPLGDRELRRRLLTRAVAELGSRSGVAVKPEEAARIVTLLETGEFYRDAASATAAVLYAVPGLPVALVKDAFRLPHRVFLLMTALGRDLVGAPLQAAAVVADLRDGHLDHPPAVLAHTFARLYDFATLDNALRTVRGLIDDNETVRLAIVLYARANGVPLELGDLDAVEALLDPAHPDLGPALAAAWERLAGRVGEGSALAAIERLGA